MFASDLSDSVAFTNSVHPELEKDMREVNVFYFLMTKSKSSSFFPCPSLCNLQRLSNICQ